MSVKTQVGLTKAAVRLTKITALKVATTRKRARRIYGSRRAIRKYQFSRTQFRFHCTVPKIRLGKAKQLKKFLLKLQPAVLTFQVCTTQKKNVSTNSIRLTLRGFKTQKRALYRVVTRPFLINLKKSKSSSSMKAIS